MADSQNISAYLRSRFPTGRMWRCASVIMVFCHVTVLAPQQTFAQDVRVTFSFLRPGGSGPQALLFGFEMLDAVPLGDLSLPAVKLVSTDSGTKVTNYTMALPVLSLAGLSVTPQYGEQNLSLMASSLSWVEAQVAEGERVQLVDETRLQRLYVDARSSHRKKDEARRCAECPGVHRDPQTVGAVDVRFRVS